MKEYGELAWQMERVIHKYIRYEKKSQKYPGDLMLTQPEIHTVALIGDNEGINVTSLAEKRGITKGAVSQMLYKLVEKGLVEKRTSPDSDSEINLYLTKQGKKVRAEHRKKYEAMWEKFSGLLQEIPGDTLKKIEYLLGALEEELDR